MQFTITMSVDLPRVLNKRGNEIEIHVFSYSINYFFQYIVVLLHIRPLSSLESEGVPVNVLFYVLLPPLSRSRSFLMA